MEHTQLIIQPLVCYNSALSKVGKNSLMDTLLLLYVLVFLCIPGDARVHDSVTPGGSKHIELCPSGHVCYRDNIAVTPKCNLFSGRWIHDVSYPLYIAADCPYSSTQFNCRADGRADSDYEKWKWQPDGCTIPRFNSNDMLDRLRGKRLIFVGDSISREQFESMVCLLQGGVPSNKKSMVYGTNLTTFKALDYNATVEFFWAPFLVELETNKEGKTILHIDSIKEYGMYWKGADIMVFESSHWWDHTGGRSGQTCENETEPAQNTSANNPPLPPQVPILKHVLTLTKFPVALLDITGMCQLRKDAHPSKYDSPKPSGNGDCSHWCSPGMPDIWNELLYYFVG